MRTIGQAFTLLAAVTLACFAAQAALPLPGRGNLIAAQALKQLPIRRAAPVHQSIGSTVTVSARCASHHLIRKSTAVGTLGPVIRTWIEGRRSPSVPVINALPPRLKFRFAACPRALRVWVGTELARANPVAIASVRYAGTATYRLTFLTQPLLVVYVDRQTLSLVAVNVRVRRALGLAM